jgi:hypothetical protein
MVVAVSIQAMRIIGKPVQYMALGKIMAAMHVPAHNNTRDPSKQTTPTIFYRTQIEILQSGILRTKAAQRVQGLHPELKECDVNILVTRASEIIDVAAVGTDREYTTAFVDALLDEYMAANREISQKECMALLKKMSDRSLNYCGPFGHPIAIMKRPSDAYKHRPSFLGPLLVTLGVGFIGVVLMSGIAGVAAWTAPVANDPTV